MTYLAIREYAHILASTLTHARKSPIARKFDLERAAGGSATTFLSIGSNSVRRETLTIQGIGQREAAN